MYKTALYSDRFQVLCVRVHVCVCVSVYGFARVCRGGGRQAIYMATPGSTFITGQKPDRSDRAHLMKLLSMLINPKGERSEDWNKVHDFL